MTDETSDADALARMLADVADDPDAPPTSVTALSVIAAARSAVHGDAARSAAGQDGSESDTLAETDVIATGSALEPAATRELQVPPSKEPAVPPSREAAVPPSKVPTVPEGTVGELHVLAARADADAARGRRRRTGLIALVAAASLAGIAAIVIQLTVGGSQTSTSSAAPDAGAQSAAAGPGAPGSVGAAAAVPPAAGQSAAAEQGSGQAGSAATGSAAAGGNADANRPPPGPEALTQSVPVAGAPPPAATPGPAAPSCWPALSDAAAAALTATLPAGAFGPPSPLTLGCGQDAVAGALLVGTDPGKVLVVRVTKAEPGACASVGSEASAACVDNGNGVYLSANSNGLSSALAYGNGYQVEVGGRPATGVAPVPSGLTADQLVAAAKAVLGTLG